MQQAQDAVALGHRLVELMARQAEVMGDGLQHFDAHAVERAIQPADLLLEVGRLLRPDIGRHLRRVAVAGRQVAAHVPEFLQVMVGRALGCLDPERDVAALAALADHVLSLHVLGQGEEALGGVDGVVDPGLRHVVVGYRREAVSPEAVAERPGEGLEVGVVERERDGLDR